MAVENKKLKRLRISRTGDRVGVQRERLCERVWGAGAGAGGQHRLDRKCLKEAGQQLQGFQLLTI